jgi:hypothetical protein
MNAILQRGRECWKNAGLVCLLLFIAAGTALPAKWASASPRNAAAVSAPASSRFAIADFDGDSKPDLATVQEGRVTASSEQYWIRVRLSAGRRQYVGVTAPVGGLQIVPRDVNGDQTLDLIVTTAWLDRPVAVLVNDGHGNFAVSDPANFPAAMRTSEAIWNHLAVVIRDTAVVAPSRNFPATESGAKSDYLLRDTRQTLLGTASSRANFDSVFSILGRAPPAFIQ